MTIEAYLQIQNNLVTNNVMWSGDIAEWQPPTDATMLITADTIAMIWELNSNNTDYVLTEKLGQAQIGFSWNGTVCVTNEEKPVIKS